MRHHLSWLFTVCFLFTTHAFANPQIVSMQADIQKAEQVLAQLLTVDQKTYNFFKELADTMNEDYKKFEYSEEYQSLQTAIDTAKGWLKAQQNPQIAFCSQDIVEIRTQLSSAMIVAEQIVLEDKEGPDPVLVADTREALKEFEEIPLDNQPT